MNFPNQTGKQGDMRYCTVSVSVHVLTTCIYILLCLQSCFSLVVAKAVGIDAGTLTEGTLYPMGLCFEPQCSGNHFWHTTSLNSVSMAV